MGRLLVDSNLATTFACYPSLVWCLLLQPIRWHLKCHIVCAFNNGVTISILWCHDETKSLLWVHTQGCAARHTLVSRLLVMIHYGTPPMCYFHVSSSLVISLYLI
jgi:hypothetical protein